jgi:hypothetical protein
MGAGAGNIRPSRFPSPLVKPDVRISRMRLSGWLHTQTHERAPIGPWSRTTPKEPNTRPSGNWQVPCDDTW